MNLGAIIEVAIGLIFVWIVLSLATIQLQESINARLDKRARDMEAAIHEMLANPNLKAQFYDHPVIRGLTSKKRKEPSKIPAWFYKYPILRGFTKEVRKLPSYIPTQQFSLALFEITMTAGTESSLIQQGLLKIRDDLENDKKMTPQQAVVTELNLLIEFARSAASTEAGTAFTKKTLAALKTKVEEFSLEHPELRPVIEAALEEAGRRKGEIDALLKRKDAPRGRDAFTSLRKGVAALSVISPEFNQTFNALMLNIEEYVGQQESKLAKARQNMEKWFDDSMDRVSGVFKRESQQIALLIGLGIALVLNVDSISLTSYLWREPSIRAAVVANAEKLIPPESSNGQPTDSQRVEVQELVDQFTELKLPVGWTLRTKDDPLFTADASGNAMACKPMPQGKAYFGIPFYDYRLTQSLPFIKDRCLTTSQPDRSTNIFVKLFGIAITAVAARQGAPFWFDLLKKAVNLRATGENPAEKEGK